MSAPIGLIVVTPGDIIAGVVVVVCVLALLFALACELFRMLGRAMVNWWKKG